MFVSPAFRISPITVFRRAAITCGMLPQRPCDRSASQGTSRTHCDVFSLGQWPRTHASKRAASARSGATLVLPSLFCAALSRLFADGGYLSL
jgi:hypothetical protein